METQAAATATDTVAATTELMLRLIGMPSHKAIRAACQE